LRLNIQAMRLLLILFFSAVLQSRAADTTKLYNPKANAEKDIAAAVLQAKKEGKHVLLQIGGNWCIWCYRFNSFVMTDSVLKNLVQNNYVVYHLNYSPENKNAATLKKLGFPQRFGFPVFVVLDKDGVRIHTQDSSLLEKGNGYDTNKVKAFFKAWSPAALNEAYYKE